MNSLETKQDQPEVAGANRPHLLRIKFGLGLVTMSTLLLQLSLIRTLDVILNPVMGYMVITVSMFALGLGGIYLFVFKSKTGYEVRSLPALACLYALLALSILPAFNWLPFNLDFGGTSLILQLLSWAGMYLVLTAPFFIGGIIISILFSNFSSESHGLYFFDLTGAGMGCLILVPLIPHYGPGGLLFLISGLLLIAGYLFTSWKIKRLYFLVPVFLALVLYPLSLNDYMDFRGHGNKRGVDDLIQMGFREYVRWDPVSKLDVISAGPNSKNFSLDGGQQGSWLQKFDGNYEVFTRQIREQPEDYFYGISSAVHYLKQGKDAEVLIIGAAVGSETKTALIFGASHVDAIDLVGAMVEAVKTRYVEFSGGVFVHPKVNYPVGEGRTFLRSSPKRYDIIQMFSNHTSCSLASGSGVLSSVYLQTAEAYMEYFEHLKEDGVLQINHHLYPRMITTAGLGWHKLGRTHFERHVLVFERFIPDNLPTLLIKMTPWTQEEVGRLYQYMNREKTGRLQERPPAAKPSRKVVKNNPFRAGFIADANEINGISLIIGTYYQEKLDYPITLKIFDSNGALVGSGSLPGEGIGDNNTVEFKFETVTGTMGRNFEIEISSDNPHPEKGFSVWLTRNGTPAMLTSPRPPMPAYQIAFNPLRPEDNLIPAEFLAHPFPEETAAQADYVIRPATDDKPHFNMIRKSNSSLSVGTSKYLDGGTAYFLNNQLRQFLPYDWISLFVVGGMSILFSFIFILIPFTSTPLGRTRWEGMPVYLVYFSCLGAGFIIIELTFIQIFTKLIGFPTHTFATVIFTLLFAAGIGSMTSRRKNWHVGKRWFLIFTGILLYGLFLVGVYPTLFGRLLGLPLPLRITAASALMFPLGFFLGMPFPLGMLSLGKVEPKGIPWAWGMNGFFTVFGGYVGLLISIWIGFRAVLFFALGIYSIAFIVYFAISRISPSTGGPAESV